MIRSFADQLKYWYYVESQVNLTSRLNRLLTNDQLLILYRCHKHFSVEFGCYLWAINNLINLIVSVPEDVGPTVYFPDVTVNNAQRNYPH